MITVKFKFLIPRDINFLTEHPECPKPRTPQWLQAGGYYQSKLMNLEQAKNFFKKNETINQIKELEIEKKFGLFSSRKVVYQGPFDKRYFFDLINAAEDWSPLNPDFASLPKAREAGLIFFSELKKE